MRLQVRRRQFARAALMSALLLSASRAALPQATPPEPALLELEPVLVTGERPGPAMWKVSWRDHVLWLLPTLSPLPRELVWRSAAVERAIGESREVFFEAALAMRLGGHGKGDLAIHSALVNRDGRWLRDFLEPELYARFAALNARYGGGDARREVLRPFYAAMELRDRATLLLQLDPVDQVHERVMTVARSHGVPIRLLGREIAPRERTLLRNLQRITMQADIDCARSQLLQMEHELRDAMARANAWALGDIEALRFDWSATQAQEQDASCRQVLQQLAPTAREIRETRDKGYTALRDALRRNHSTVALVLIEEVFDPAGIVSRLRKAGYRVEEPAR